jgi:hypothetical protein
MLFSLFAAMIGVQAAKNVTELCGAFLVQADYSTIVAFIEAEKIPPSDVFQYAMDEATKKEGDVLKENHIGLAFTMAKYVDEGKSYLAAPFKVTNIPDTLYPVVTMGINLAQDVIVEKLEEKRQDFYNENAVSDADQIGTIIGLRVSDCKDGSAPVVNTDPKRAMGYISGLLSLAGITCIDLDKLADGLSISLSSTLGGATIGKLKILVDGKDLRQMIQEGCSGRRRLLAMTGTAEYETGDLTVSQMEMIAAKGRQGGKLEEEMLAQLAQNGLSSMTVETMAVTPEGDGASLSYEPVEYAPTSNVESMHGAPRVNGAEPSIPDTDGDFVNYGIGAAIVAAPCFLCLFFSGFCAPCCYCCACKPKKPKAYDSPVKNPCTYISIVFGILIIVGMAIGLGGNSSTQAGLQTFEKSLNEVAAFVQEAGDDIESLKAAMTKVVDLSEVNRATCSITDNFAKSFGADIENPLEDNPSESIKDIADMIGSLGGTIGLVSTLFVVLPAVVGIIYLIMILLWILGKQLGPFKCLSKVCAPVIVLFLLLMWLVAGLNTILGVVLSDVCFTDPIDVIIKQVDSNGELGLGYLLACEGAPPEAFVELTDIGQKFAKIEPVVSNLGPLIDTEASCADTAVGAIETEFGLAAEKFLSIIDRLRCNFPNRVLSDVLYTGLCTQVVDGFVNIFIGLTLLGIGLLGNWFTWKRTLMASYARGAAVAPAETNGKGKEVEEEKIVIKGGN